MDLENGEKGYHALTKKMLGVPESEDLSELGVMKDLLKMKGEMEKTGKESKAADLQQATEQVATSVE